MHVCHTRRAQRLRNGQTEHTETRMPPRMKAVAMEAAGMAAVGTEEVATAAEETVAVVTVGG